jgi:hypothetical protein
VTPAAIVSSPTTIYNTLKLRSRVKPPSS